MGNLYAETADIEGKLKFRITVGVQNEISTLEGFLGREDDQNILQLNSDDAATNNLPRPHATAILDKISPTEMAGKWKSVLGHAGVFWLKRVHTSQPQTDEGTSKPVQLLAKEVSLPKFSLYREELETLIEKLRNLVGPNNDVVITTRIDKNDITVFAAEFLKRKDLPYKLSHLRLNINDGRQPIQNSINIVLSDILPSQFFVQSDNNIWLNGAFTELNEFFQRFTGRITTMFQKHGLNVNGILFLGVIATLPELTLTNRYIFMLVAFALMAIFWKFHSYANSTKIYTSPSLTRNWLSNETPRIISGIFSTILAAVMVAIASLAYKILLEGHVSEWFSAFRN